MRAVQFKGVTRTLGESQGYLALPIRDAFEDQSPIMISNWKPEPDELAALISGKSIELIVCGAQHPPVSIGIAE